MSVNRGGDPAKIRPWWGKGAVQAIAGRGFVPPRWYSTANSLPIGRSSCPGGRTPSPDVNRSSEAESPRPAFTLLKILFDAAASLTTMGRNEDAIAFRLGLGASDDFAASRWTFSGRIRASC